MNPSDPNKTGNDSLSLVFVTAQPFEANMVKAMLEASDLTVFIIDENTSRIYPGISIALGGIKLCVPKAQEGTAKQLLHDHFGQPESDVIAGKVSPFDFQRVNKLKTESDQVRSAELPLKPVAVCPHCGASAERDSKFCDQCSEFLYSPPVQYEVEATPISGNTSPLAGTVPTQQGTPEELTVIDSRTSSDSNTIGAFVVIGIFLGAIAVISSNAPSWLYGHTIGYVSARLIHKVPPPMQRFDVNQIPAEFREEISVPLQELLKKTDAGDARSEYLLGWKYYFGLDVPQNDQLALQWIRKAADKGFAKAEYSMGYFASTGVAIPENDLEAFQWFEKAAKQGNAKAQFYLASAYQLGKGTAKSDALSISWLQKAVDLGYAPAQDALGYAYHNGEGVVKDEQKAIELFRKAADKGNATAESHLAYCYMQGLGVAQDYNQAYQLAEKAAWHGNRSAQYNLGTLYETGKGVPKSRVEMYAWFLIADSNGDEAAKKAAADWKMRLSAGEIVEGHEAANRYRERIYAIMHGTISDQE